MRREKRASAILVVFGFLLVTSPGLFGAEANVCTLVSGGLSVQKDTDANGVLEPGETAAVNSSWRLTGFLCSLTAIEGSASPLTNSIVFVDNTSDFKSGHSYVVSIEPGLAGGHRDAKFREDVSATYV